MLTLLTAAALRWMELQRQRTALRRLLTHDDATLEDIGLSRADIERRLARPLGANVDHPALWPATRRSHRPAPR